VPLKKHEVVTIISLLSHSDSVSKIAEYYFFFLIQSKALKPEWKIGRIILKGILTEMCDVD
jgi:hypothetical protein